MTGLGRSIRRGAVHVVGWITAILFVAVLLSWLLSVSHPHGVTVTGRRQYALFAHGGFFEFRRTIKTEIVQKGGWDAWEVAEVPLRGDDEPVEVRWRPPAGPRLAFSMSRIVSDAEILRGGEVPEPSTGRMTPVGEQTIARAVPHWVLAVVLGVPVAWWVWTGFERRRARRRAAAGLCRGCGYDLRASPDRCPECGLVAR